MKINNIAWKRSYKSNKVDPLKAYSRIEEIRSKKNNRITINDLLEEAEDIDSILHDLFEWDDSEAAKEYRKIQAGLLIRSFEITYEERPSDPVRAYEVIYKKPRQSKVEETQYTTHSEIMDDESARSDLLDEALRALISWRKRYRQLNEFAIVFSRIDEVSESLINKN